MTKRLGRGLADLIDAPGAGQASFVMLRVDQIRSGAFQPREQIGEEALEELKASIKRSGVIEPVVVRPIAHGTYELVAGERRLRATQALGMQEIPAIIKTLSDQEALEFSLIENVQRENLNPIEEANGYARLIEEFGYTQEDIAASVGKDRATVANLLRLRVLPGSIQQAIRRGELSMGHARALLSVADSSTQEALCRQVMAKGLSVRQTEALTWTLSSTSRKRPRRPGDPQLAAIADALRKALGTKVTVAGRSKGGRIIVEYFSSEDLSRILQALGVSL